MMPTHEVRRELHEAMKILRRMHDSKQPSLSEIDTSISLLKQAYSTVGGIGRMMQRTEDIESFELEKPAKMAIELSRHRLERNGIAYELDVRRSKEIVASLRLVTMLLLNFIDNSIYWLLRKRPEERKIKIIVDLQDDKAILAVSDSGPGFGEDDIQTVTLPFFTRKPNGMGLGLYIADRIAGMNRGKLKLLTENDLSGLLSGGNIAAIFPTNTR
jgi:signal transduction histidine kinase